jgi:hypothetical protein
VITKLGVRIRKVKESERRGSARVEVGLGVTMMTVGPAGVAKWEGFIARSAMA